MYHNGNLPTRYQHFDSATSAIELKTFSFADEKRFCKLEVGTLLDLSTNTKTSSCGCVMPTLPLFFARIYR